jgi:phosphoribosylaminoimidazole-succinocarboxamide synthase
MSLADKVLTITNDFPIRNQGTHDGKVRSVYWLTNEDSKRIIEENGFELLPTYVHPDSPLGIMITSDKISAFDVNWQSEELKGIPGKGIYLNAISNYWFNLFKSQGISENHLIESIHPQVWLVQKAQPIKIEAIAREYITGSMWRAYDKGKKIFCGMKLPEGLEKNQNLGSVLLTPTTKGSLNIPGIPHGEDVNITRDQITMNWSKLGFKELIDVFKYERILNEGFELASTTLNGIGEVLVDTKLELGYVRHPQEGTIMTLIDEVLTPDSSRLWDLNKFSQLKYEENSKEPFRDFLRKRSGLDENTLLYGTIPERKQLATEYKVPVDIFFQVSDTYRRIASKITGNDNLSENIENPREEILEVLAHNYQIIL